MHVCVYVCACVLLNSFITDNDDCNSVDSKCRNKNDDDINNNNNNINNN